MSIDINPRHSSFSEGFTLLCLGDVQVSGIRLNGVDAKNPPATFNKHHLSTTPLDQSCRHTLDIFGLMLTWLLHVCVEANSLEVNKA